ncbi:uncharacterized protein K452DRAFT_77823 [Aplosporella prunicola CBS 121167]|uniref:Zn(2)-C6 fungal-type domain-containing protein n=1 Tax=Aplosporella prunicola CBS 121167 TaxID=1176127 RepID=A0A6A6B7Y3_9PEZI|nr:uncharacterized protein K452DRAFT_77823 [Aplosporella prunicola CBS 121167]KAF2139473.1 hypothetical protein K452DRAFT_77823 [Aplosporella prunicola CBS 121167]
MAKYKTMTTGMRQQPGLACEECRRRKARCDRARPQCSTCTESGTPCVVVDKRPPRGPKKGRMKALRNRVASLEWQLYGQSGLIDPDAESQTGGSTASTTAGTESPGQASFYDMDHGIVGMASPTSGFSTSIEPLPLTPISICSDLYSNSYSSNECPMTLPSLSSGTTTVSKPYTPNATPISSTGALGNPYTGELDMSDRVRANLDQLYFDRVHAILPMIHERRYFSWAGQENLDLGRESLRSAMQTMAATMSSSHRSLSKALYAQTRQMLNVLDALEPATVQLEHIQTSLLVAHYEHLQVSERQAMLTAGRAFRLIQMSRLYDVDGVGDVSSASFAMADESFARTEEKRRSFWVAFAFDRFLNMANEWPFTLHEELICTRLPAPETNFQNNQPIQTGFLPEAVVNSGHSTLSPLAECVVLAALYGRCMNHRGLAHAAVVSGSNPDSIRTRIEWLAAILEKRSLRLAQTSPMGLSVVERNPLLAFAHVLVHSAIIHLYHTTHAAPFNQLLTLDSEQQAYHSASYIAELAKAVPRMDCFKIHPFFPNVLSSAATFLMLRVKSTVSDTSQELDQLLVALQCLRDVNLLARDQLRALEAGRWAMSSNL